MSAETGVETAVSVTDAAWEAIRGGYDLHVHVSPDLIARRIDDIGLAHEFLACGLRGFALKSHYIPTTERAKVVAKAAPGVEVFGTISLNHAIGGINPVAVEIAGRSGCKIVWMPTVDAANETAGRPGSGHAKLPFWAQIQRDLAAMGIAPPPMSPLDAEGRLTEPTRLCLEIIARHDMVLATSHLGRTEIFPLVKAAAEMGVRKIVVTHAEFPSQNLTPDEQVELSRMGAVIEHCFTTMHTAKATWAVFFEAVRKVGPERTLLSTDLGQTINPPVSVGFAMFAQKLLDEGFSACDVRRMAVTNPEALIE